MLAEVLGVINLMVLLYLGIFIIRDRTEVNIQLWTYGLRLDDIEERVSELEKK